MYELSFIKNRDGFIVDIYHSMKKRAGQIPTKFYYDRYRPLRRILNSPNMVSEIALCDWNYDLDECRPFYFKHKKLHGEGVYNKSLKSLVIIFDNQSYFGELQWESKRRSTDGRQAGVFAVRYMKPWKCDAFWVMEEVNRDLDRPSGTQKRSAKWYIEKILADEKTAADALSWWANYHGLNTYEGKTIDTFCEFIDALQKRDWPARGASAPLTCG
jgi:hypothetical protein